MSSVAVIGLSAVAFLLLVSLVFRETLRLRALDRRLAAPRGQMAALTPALARRSRPGSGAAGALHGLGLAAARLGSILVPVGAAEREKLTRMLRRAGFGRPEALSYFLSAKLASAFTLAVGAGLLASGSEAVGEHRLLVVMAVPAGLVIGGIVPEYVLRAIAARSARGIASALPDALDMVVMCLEAGLTTERALTTVADELVSYEPGLAREFRQIEAELRLASDRRAAIGEYYRRTEIDGLRDLAMALIQGERYGTPMSQSMRAIAASERLQKAARIATQAERLPVLMTLPMLLLVMPGTMLLVAGPAVLSAMQALGNLGG